MTPQDEAEDKPLAQAEAEGSSTSSGSPAPVRLLRLRSAGLLLHSFGISFCLQGMNSLLYGVLLGYLNVPAHVYAIATVLIGSRPFSFTLLWGAVSDAFPIRGYRRMPYLVLGWSLTTMTLAWVLLSEPLPPPFFCRDAAGRYIRTVNASGHVEQAPPCNGAAPAAAPPLVLKLTLVTLMQGCAQAAANGLLVEYCRRDSRYGRTQVWFTGASTVGFIASQCLIGFGMNSFEFNGSFRSGLSFTSVVGILTAVSGLIVVAQLWCNEDDEPRVGAGGGGAPQHEPLNGATVRRRPLAAADDEPELRLPREHCSGSGSGSGSCLLHHLRLTLSSRAAVAFLLWVLLVEAALPNVQSPAVGLSQEIWAGVQVLPRAVAGVLTAPIYIGGLLAVERYGLGWSYQRAFLGLTVLTVLIDSAFKYPNVLGAVRNQWFTLGEDFALKFPMAALGVIESMASIALSPAGAEALWLGVVDLAAAAGYPLGRVVGNAIFARFEPSLSDSANFFADTVAFRRTVALSYLVGHVATLVGVCTVRMIPDQRGDATRRLREWPRHPGYALMAAAVILAGFWLGVGGVLRQMGELVPENVTSYV
jgi:hypothetical protein